MNEDLNILTEDLIDFCNALESAVVKLRMQIEKLTGPIQEPKAKAPSILEKNFDILKWASEKGSKLGDYEVAYENHNIRDDWIHAYNILKSNKSLIADSFHCEGYAYHYWIYPEKYQDRIFRKKLADSGSQ